MKTLQEIKHNVAAEKGWKHWDDLMVHELSAIVINEIWPIVCERAQLEACKATLEKVRKNPLIEPESNIIIIK